ncbi:MAG: hypothetical protein HQL80_10530 [Magnetococcales bacterium]|nr:hypothetical protein [Magnetococcales bacterium]
MRSGNFFPKTLTSWLPGKRKHPPPTEQPEPTLAAAPLLLAESTARRREAMQQASEAQEWQAAASQAAELCDLLLVLGRWRELLATTAQGKAWLEQRDDPLIRLYLHAQEAMAQHRLGALQQSRLLFQEAEKWQTDRQTGYHWLIGLPGKGYCDLMMDQAKVASVWEMVLHRSHYSQKISRNLFAIGLDLQTQGRALAALGQQETAAASFKQAVTTLRKANRRAFLPELLRHQAELVRRQEGTQAAWPILTEALAIAVAEGLKPAEAEARLLEAHLLLDEKRLEAAAAVLTSLETLLAELEYGQQTVAVHLLRARLLRQQGRQQEADHWQAQAVQRMETQQQWGVMWNPALKQ